MRSAYNLFKKFVTDEQGLETVEYAVIAALILAGAIGTIATVGFYVNKKFQELATALTPTP